MTQELLHLVWLVVAALGALSVLAALRILAAYRQEEIHQHQIICDAARLRADYRRRIEQRRADQAATSA